MGNRDIQPLLIGIGSEPYRKGLSSMLDQVRIHKPCIPMGQDMEDVARAMQLSQHHFQLPGDPFSRPLLFNHHHNNMHTLDIPPIPRQCGRSHAFMSTIFDRCTSYRQIGKTSAFRTLNLLHGDIKYSTGHKLAYVYVGKQDRDILDELIKR